MSFMAEYVRDGSIVLGAFITVAAAVYRYVFRRKIAAVEMFLLEAQDAIATIRRIEPDVIKMTMALGPNGGRSLADVIHRTAGRMNLLIDQLPSATWEANSDGTNSRVNPALENLFGYSAAELYNHGWKVLLYAPDAEGYIAAWMSAVKDARHFQCYCRFVTKRGAVVPVIVSASPASGLVDGSHVWMGIVRVEVYDES